MPTARGTRAEWGESVRETIDDAIRTYKRYGGAISANTLQLLLGKCKELGWAVVSLIAGGHLSAVSHTDGSPACFYIPTICEKTANLIDATLKPCNTNECAIRALFGN